MIPQAKHKPTKFELRDLLVGLVVCAMLFGAVRAIWERGGAAGSDRVDDGDAIHALQQANPQAQIESTVANILSDPNVPPYLRVVELELHVQDSLRMPELLRSLTYLESISIAGRLDPRTADELAQLRLLEKVQVLGGASPIPFGRILKAPGLKSLSLRSCKEGDQLVLELWPERPYLERLDLGQTGLTAEGIEHLSRCPPIVELDLEGNPLSKAEVDALLALYGQWKQQRPAAKFKLKVKHSNELSDEDLARLNGSGLVEVVYNRGK